MDLELSDPPRSISGLEGYQFVQFLVRLHSTPLGYVKMPVIGGGCTAAAIGLAGLGLLRLRNHFKAYPGNRLT